MVRPLTKRKKNGTAYIRRPHVQQALEALTALDVPGILERLTIVDRGHVDYVANECVVHLLREAQRRGDTRRPTDALFVPEIHRKVAARTLLFLDVRAMFRSA